MNDAVTVASIGAVVSIVGSLFAPVLLESIRGGSENQKLEREELRADRKERYAERVKEIQSLKLQLNTERDARKDIEARLEEIERQAQASTAKIAEQNEVIDALQAQNEVHENRIHDLSEELFEAYRQIATLQMRERQRE